VIYGDPDKLGADPANGFEFRHQAKPFLSKPFWAAHQFYVLTKKELLGNASLQYNITDWLYAR
jgi:hypothetical protein